MGCLGVHFSFPAGQGGRLRDGDQASLAFVEELEERWDTYYLQQTDKAWDAIHRCLADGTLAWAGGDWPLSGAILGGEPVYLGRDHIIMFLDDHDVAEIAQALDEVTQPWFRARFFALPAHGYQGRTDEAAFDYTWGWFELMRAFFRKSADEGRRMVFTADQLGARDTRDRSEKRSSHRTAPVPAPRTATPAAPGILRIAWQAWRS